MKIFLDTANIDEIRRFHNMGLLDGITTNPSLLFREGQNPDYIMEEIASMVSGDVSLEVVAT
ncbi:MAG: fructose-6-phosphate aldolase, partial [Acidimicrobiaceae bacterium]|nr:fructose-6-phosphate aldolase [Acidimicrobiaceae bacterium]